MSGKKNCTECGSDEHYAREISPGATGELLPVGSLHGAKYKVVVCGNCGYTRWFVPERFLGLVREKFEPV
ncbi:zinc ribbon domain-containing protein [Oxalobacteraceae bacterium A2-2]